MAHEVDLRIAVLAARQHGVFTVGNARAAGANSSLIARRVRSGRWNRLRKGLYELTGNPPSWDRDVAIAARMLPDPAAASHRTAAHLHGLYARPRRIEVVTRATGIRTNRVVIHQCQDLTAAEIVEVGGHPVTDVARTIIDIGVPAGVAVAQRVLDDALRKELTTLTMVAQRVHRYGRRGRRGIGPARSLVIERLEWNDITDSVLEDAFLRLAYRAGLPRPTVQRQFVLRGGKRLARVDFLFGSHLVVELDSERFHTDPNRFQDDRRRQNALVEHGLTVLRFTWWDVMAAPEYVASNIASALFRIAS